MLLIIVLVIATALAVYFGAAGIKQRCAATIGAAGVCSFVAMFYAVILITQVWK